MDDNIMCDCDGARKPFDQCEKCSTTMKLAAAAGHQLSREIEQHLSVLDSVPIGKPRRGARP